MPTDPHLVDDTGADAETEITTDGAAEVDTDHTATEVQQPEA